MPTMKDVCNQGLGKIGASRVINLSPPISVLEVKCATEYAQWKDSELAQRRWKFANTVVKLDALLTTIDPDLDGRIYQFNVPGDMLRPIRPKNCTWAQRGQFLYDRTNRIILEYIRRVADSDMSEPLFIDVLACRVAVECAELATQSPRKQALAIKLHEDALTTAGRMNAFSIEPPETGGDDIGYTWDTARAYPSLSGL